MNEIAIIVLCIVCVLIVVGVVFLLIRTCRNKSDSSFGMKEFGGIKTTFEDSTMIWKSNLTAPELIDLVSDLVLLLGFRTSIDSDNWKYKVPKFKFTDVNEFIDFSFDFAELTLKHNCADEFDSIMEVCKIADKMKINATMKIKNRKENEKISYDQAAQSVLINFGKIWLDKHQGEFKTKFDDQIGSYCSSKYLQDKRSFRLFQNDLDKQIPLNEESDSDPNVFKTYNEICGLCLLNETFNPFIQCSEGINILRIITKTLKSIAERNPGKKNLGDNFKSGLRRIIGIVNGAVNSTKTTSVFSPSLAVSMIEAIIVLEARERVTIQRIEFIDDGTFNGCFRIVINKRRRGSKPEQFALKISKRGGKDFNTMDDMRYFDEVFEDFVSYPRPIYSNYNYYLFMDPGASSGYDDDDDESSQGRSETVPKSRFIIYKSSESGSSESGSDSSESSSSESQAVPVQREIQCDWRIYKLYSEEFLTDAYPDNPRMKSLNLKKVNKYEFILSRDIKKSFDIATGTKIRFQNIYKYINQMAELQSKLHEVEAAYYDWKIGNIAMDENLNFVLIDNDFESCHGKTPHSFAKTHNIKSLSRSKRTFTQKDIQTLDKIILLKEFYTVRKARDRTEYYRMCHIDIFADRSDDHRREFADYLKNIDRSEFPFLYNLICWYIQDCTFVPRSHPEDKFEFIERIAYPDSDSDSDSDSERPQKRNEKYSGGLKLSSLERLRNVSPSEETEKPFRNEIDPERNEKISKRTWIDSEGNERLMSTFETAFNPFDM